ncbi:MAG: hypothetical protein ABFC98_01965, partial [Candidatus Cloacimonas sp.]
HIISYKLDLCSFRFIPYKLDSLFVVVDEDVNPPIFLRWVKTRRLNLSSRWDFFHFVFNFEGLTPPSL